MIIRLSDPTDIDTIMLIYEHARTFMAEAGNPHQWGDRCWPPRDLIAMDIVSGKSYVCQDDKKILATFYYNEGLFPEPGYNEIIGTWMVDGIYGVVHRIAVAENGLGIGSFCLDWAYNQCKHLRVDTHPDNRVMQNLLRKKDFKYCGMVSAADGTPRLAFEKAPALFHFDA